MFKFSRENKSVLPGRILKRLIYVKPAYSSMTHGAGAISCGGGGGGGGGFSGTTFSTPIFAAHHTTRRRRNGNNTNSDADCCAGLCYLIGFLLCLVKMKPRTRIILTWVYCIIAASVTGGLLGNYYSTYSISASPGDMRQVDNRVSKTFCSSITVDSTTLIITYKFDFEPKINFSSSEVSVADVTSVLQENTYEYWGFYLLEGSVATASVCPDSPVHVYIIKGKSNLDAWIKNSLCGDCYEKDQYIISCVYRQNITIKADGNDQYYFLFANDGSFVFPGPAKADIRFIVKRHLYDLRGATEICSHDFDCDVPLSLTKSERVVFYIPRSSLRDVEINIICKPRIYVYFLLFVLIPVFCGSLVTFLIVRLSKKGQQTRQRSDSQVFVVSEQQRLRGVANGSFSSGVPKPPSYTESPPKYEDVIRKV